MIDNLKLHKPEAGQIITVPVAKDANFDLGFLPADVTLTREGDNLVFSFEDGGKVVVSDFYATVTKESLPDFLIDGQKITGADFFAALGEDLQPAAGPAAQRGANFNEYDGANLLGGVDSLGGKDYGYNREGAVDRLEAENGYNRRGGDAGNDGVLIGNAGDTGAVVPSEKTETEIEHTTVKKTITEASMAEHTPSSTLHTGYTVTVKEGFTATELPTTKYGTFSNEGGNLVFTVNHEYADKLGIGQTLSINKEFTFTDAAGNTVAFTLESLQGNNFNDDTLILANFSDSGTYAVVNTALVKDHTSLVDGAYTIKGGTIDLGEGDDKLTILGTMTGGVIRGNVGDDSITVKGTMSNGLIAGGVGEDTITVDKMTNGKVDGNEGDDTIYVKDMSAGVVFGGDYELTNSNTGAGTGNNTITVDNLTGGHVNAGVNDDTIYLGKMSGATNYFITNGGNNYDTGANGAYVDGASGKDTIYLTSTLDNYTGGVVMGGGDDDTLYLNHGNTDGVKLSFDKFGITPFSFTQTANADGVYEGYAYYGGMMADGNLRASGVDANGNANTFVLQTGHGTVFNGIDLLHTGDGNDTVTLGAMDGNTIDCGGGNNTFILTGSTSEYPGGALKNGTVELAEGLVITYDATAKTWKVGGMAIESPQGVDLTAGAFLSVINATEAFAGCENPNGTWNTAAVASIVMQESGVSITFDPTAANVIDWDGMVYSGATLNGTIGGDEINVNNYVFGTINGGKGDDRINVDGTGTGDKFAVLTNGKVEGGDGDDTITIKGHVQGTVDGGADNDTIDITGYVYGTVSGGAGNDEITINAGGTDGYTLINANIDGDAGNDIITVNGHMVGSTITGGTGKDVFIYNANDGTGRTLTMDASGNVAGTAATVSGFEGIGGGTGNDTIDASAYTEGAILIGGKGADKLTGGNGEDIFVWRADDFDGKTDTITNFGAGDKLYLGGLNSENAACLKTGDGMFTVQYTTAGTPAVNHLITIKFDSGAPEDVNAFWGKVIAGTGTDTIPGFDTTPTGWAIDTGTLTDPAAIDIQPITDPNRTSCVAGETIEGGAGNDTITVTGTGYMLSGATINGGYGNDTINITGYVLNSTINGGANDDVITLNAPQSDGILFGSNTIDGGDGHDVFIFNDSSNRGHIITLDNAGNVQIDSNMGGAANLGGQTITGFEGIGGGAGNDTLDARGYTGGAFLIGGAGSDTLWGGTGADTFKWSIADLGGTDTVMNFKASQGDTIVIEGLDSSFTVTVNANNANGFDISNGTVTQTIIFENTDATALAQIEAQIQAAIPT